METNLKTEKAYFGAGCFWGVQKTFDVLPGVISTVVGYAGGHTENPTYKDVCYNETGHAEVIEIEFDPSVVTFNKLLEKFFQIHNPTLLNRQGPDVGTQYRSIILYTDESQKQASQDTISHLNSKKFYPDPVVTEVSPLKAFYPAEEYHQKYLEKRNLNTC